MGTRLLLMAGQQEYSYPPPPPPDEPPVDPPADGNFYVTTDANINEMRPHGRIILSARVGVGVPTHGTLNAALTAYQAYLDADVYAGGALFWDMPGPDYQSNIFVNEAVHAGFGTGGWQNVIGPDPTHKATIYSNTIGGGTIHTYGSAYLENLNIQARGNVEGTGGPKYPWHITGGTMQVAVNCIFDASGPAVPDGGLAGVVGMDGVSGHTVIFYNCQFIGRGFNMHGPANGDPVAEPMTYCFVNCTSEFPLSASSTAVVGGGKSKIYVMNCVAPSVETDANCDVYTDSATITVTGANTVTRGVSTWPVPVNGQSAYWQGYYYPSVVGSSGTLTPGGPGTTFAPVPNRTYLTKVPFTTAMKSRRIRITATVAAGNVGLLFSPVDTPYVWDDPPPTSAFTAGIAVSLGVNEWQHFYAYTRYPGQNGVWARCKFTDAAVRVLGSTTVGGLTECYYTDDGTTMVPVNAGTAHPVMTIAT